MLDTSSASMSLPPIAGSLPQHPALRVPAHRCSPDEASQSAAEALSPIPIDATRSLAPEMRKSLFGRQLDSFWLSCRLSCFWVRVAAAVDMNRFVQTRGVAYDFAWRKVGLGDPSGIISSPR